MWLMSCTVYWARLIEKERLLEELLVGITKYFNLATSTTATFTEIAANLPLDLGCNY